MNWRRSSSCESGNCAEVLVWRTSSSCDTGTCVAVVIEPDRVLVRNSQRPDVVVEFDAAEWTAFINGAKEGEFDVQ